MNEYQRQAMRTQSHDAERELVLNPKAAALLNAILGLCGEAGECADLYKKVLFHGHSLNIEKMAKEVGDVQWYIAQASQALGMVLEDIAAANITKLRERYPEGFQSERSINRADI